MSACNQPCLSPEVLPFDSPSSGLDWMSQAVANLFRLQSFWHTSAVSVEGICMEPAIAAVPCPCLASPSPATASCPDSLTLDHTLSRLDIRRHDGTTVHIALACNGLHTHGRRTQPSSPPRWSPRTPQPSVRSSAATSRRGLGSGALLKARGPTYEQSCHSIGSFPGGWLTPPPGG